MKLTVVLLLPLGPLVSGAVLAEYGRMGGRLAAGIMVMAGSAAVEGVAVAFW